MAAVSFREVKKDFGKTRVLHGISLEIPDGEIYGFLGPLAAASGAVSRASPRHPLVTPHHLVHRSRERTRQGRPSDTDMRSVSLFAPLPTSCTGSPTVLITSRIGWRGIAHHDDEPR